MNHRLNSGCSFEHSPTATTLSMFIYRIFFLSYLVCQFSYLKVSLSLVKTFGIGESGLR